VAATNAALVSRCRRFGGSRSGRREANAGPAGANPLDRPLLIQRRRP